MEPYHGERNHQGLEIIEPDFEYGGEGGVNCYERLGGLLRYYYRDAAWILAIRVSGHYGQPYSVLAPSLSPLQTRIQNQLILEKRSKT